MLLLDFFSYLIARCNNPRREDWSTLLWVNMISKSYRIITTSIRFLCNSLNLIKFRAHKISLRKGEILLIPLYLCKWFEFIPWEAGDLSFSWLMTIHISSLFHHHISITNVPNEGWSKVALFVWTKIWTFSITFDTRSPKPYPILGLIFLMQFWI